MNFDIERTCRLNGKKPTPREAWTAFYRLWRTLQNNVSAQVMTEASECFRVLMNNWRWIKLVDGPGDYYESLRFMPRPVRWSKVKRGSLIEKLCHAIMSDDPA